MLIVKPINTVTNNFFGGGYTDCKKQLPNIKFRLYFDLSKHFRFLVNNRIISCSNTLFGLKEEKRRGEK